VQLEAGSGHGGWRPDVQVLDTLGQLSDHPVHLHGTHADDLSNSDGESGVSVERVAGLAGTTRTLRCASKSRLIPAACLLRDVVVVASDPGEKATGLRNWHAHLANTALRRGDSKVDHLRRKRFMVRVNGLVLDQGRWRLSQCRGATAMMMPDPMSTHLPSAPRLPQPRHELPLGDLLGRAPQRAHRQRADGGVP
jgi:hypothetical protein